MGYLTGIDDQSKLELLIIYTIIINTNIRTIHKCFETESNRISLMPEKLKECDKSFVYISSLAEKFQIKHPVMKTELINEHIAEIDKKTEEFSVQNNSPIHTRNFSFR